MYCKKCNLTFDDSFKYCNQCGSELISDLDAMGLALAENQEGAFEQFYEATNLEITDHLYHRVPIDQLASAVEEFYTKLLIDLKSYEPEMNFTNWFADFINRFILRYTGIHQLFGGDEEKLTEPAPSLALPEIRTEKDIAMRAERRISLLNMIMEGVSEKERICVSLRYVDQMSLAEIAREMHTTENVIAHHFYNGNEKMYNNFNKYEIEQNNNLFGMNSLSFIIWLLQYDDFAHVEPMDPQKILDSIKVKNPAETVAEYKALDEVPKAADGPRKRRRQNGGDLSYKKAKEETKTPKRYEGYEAPKASKSAGGRIVQILIGVCIVVIVVVAAMIVRNIFASDDGEETADDSIATTATASVSTQDDTEEATTESKESTISLSEATPLYEAYLEEQGEDGVFYGIIEAGENGNPIMIVSDYENEDEDTDYFLPAVEDQGYDLAGIYSIEDGEVISIANGIEQSEDDQAWRVYNDELTAYYTQDGSEQVRTIEISGDTYKDVKSDVPDDYDNEAEVISLERFTTEDSEEATTEAEEEGEEVYYTAYITTGVKVREKPDASSEQVNSLGYGTQVTVIRESGEWVKLQEYDGWIMKQYTTTELSDTTTEETTEVTEETTSTSEETTATTETSGESRTVTIASPAGALTVHSEPDASSSNVGTLTNGEQVTVSNIQGEWGQLSSGGWIYLGYTN